MSDRTVTLTEDAYFALCGLVHPSDEEVELGGVNHAGIFGPFDELRAKFPLSDFRSRAAGDLDFYDPEAGL